MNENETFDGSCYRELILHSSKPIVFRKCLRWELLNWNIEDWIRILHSKPLIFRIGSKTCQESPIWESEFKTERRTIQDFVEFCNNDEKTKKEWWYFDYKHIPEYFLNDQNIFESISWNDVGFPERGAENSTVWIGSSGAHTPCHYDSYGCNVVAQILGRKRWLLFPPAEIIHLKPTRVPYEESSIYSDINFSCYHSLKDTNIDCCYAVDLDPGDILFVPPKWWHYVENLTLAISINSWIPRESEDNISRLDEALVKYFISSVTDGIPNDMKHVILNPNEKDLKFELVHMDIIQFCKEKIRQRRTKNTIMDLKYDNKSDHLRPHCHEYSFLRKTSLRDIIEMSMKTHVCDGSNLSDSLRSDHNDISNLTSIINAFCHPDIILRVRNKLLEDL